MQNPLIQTLLNNLKIKNPQGHQVIQNLMQSNGNPQTLLQQLMSNTTPEQKKDLLGRAKQYGCPDNVLSQIQNMK